MACFMQLHNVCLIGDRPGAAMFCRVLTCIQDWLCMGVWLVQQGSWCLFGDWPKLPPSPQEKKGHWEQPYWNFRNKNGCKQRKLLAVSHSVFQNEFEERLNSSPHHQDIVNLVDLVESLHPLKADWWGIVHHTEAGGGDKAGPTNIGSLSI